MLNSVNTDITAEALNTNYPFQTQCALSLGDYGTLPVLSFMSVSLALDAGSIPPVRLDTVAKDDTEDTGVTATFVDYYGSVVGLLRLPSVVDASYADIDGTNRPYASSYILNANNVIVGHAVYRTDIPAVLSRAATLTGGTLKTNGADFVLLPQCILSGSTSHYVSAFRLGDSVYSCDTSIYTSNLMHTTIGESNAYWELGVVGEYTSHEDVNGICRLDVDNTVMYNGNTQTSTTPTWVGGQNLVIRSSIASNIRVIPDNNGIRITGASDV